MPSEARWSPLQANAEQSTIGKLIDRAQSGSEGRKDDGPALNAVMLGEQIDFA